MLPTLALLVVSLETSTIHKVAASGRCVTLAEKPGKRVEPRKIIAPGLPPMLSFRSYEDKKNHRYANLDLMLDDAGH